MSERPALRAAKARLRDKFFRTKWLVAFIAAAVLLFFGRVTNIRPLSQSALVIGVGIDLADDGFDVSALSVVVSGGDGTTPSETYVVTTAQGATVSEALDKISQKMGLLVSLSHCNVLVLSPRSFSVDHVRLLLPLVSSFSLPEQAAVTATESKPSDVLAARTATDASAFFVQASLLQNLGGDGIALVTVKDFLAASLSRSGSVNIPVIDIREPEHQPSGQSGGGEVKELVMGRNLVVHGGETFFLEEDLAQAATMLVRDKVKGRLSVTLRDGTAVELRVIDASPSLSADGIPSSKCSTRRAPPPSPPPTTSSAPPPTKPPATSKAVSSPATPSPSNTPPTSSGLKTKSTSTSATPCPKTASRTSRSPAPPPSPSKNPAERGYYTPTPPSYCFIPLSCIHFVKELRRKISRAQPAKIFASLTTMSS